MNQIKNLRVKNKMKQVDLALRLNVKQNTISNWETGRTEPDSDSLIEMAHVFGVTTDYILGRTIHEKKAVTPKDDGRRTEFARLFETLTQDQQDFVLAAMRGMKPEK